MRVAVEQSALAHLLSDVLQIFFTGLRLQPAPGTEGEALKKWVDVMQPENEGMVSQRVGPPGPAICMWHTQAGIRLASPPQWSMLVRMSPGVCAGMGGKSAAFMP